MRYICAPGYFYDHGFRTCATPALAIGCSRVGAQSTGHVRLRSGDPKDKPAITANYLKEPEDMQAMITAAERAREIFASAPLRGLVGKEIHTGGDTSSRQALGKVIRREVEHTYIRPAPPGSAPSPAGWWIRDFGCMACSGCGSPTRRCSLPFRTATPTPRR